MAFVWEDVFDGAEGEHDEGEGGFGGVESVGPIVDQSYSPVEAFVAGVVHAEPDRRQDPAAAFADGLGQGDERFQAAAGGLPAEPVEQLAGLRIVQVAGECGAQRLLEAVRPPERAALTTQLAQGGGLLVGEVGGVLQQALAGALELAGRVGIDPTHLLPCPAADDVQGLGGQGHDVERVIAITACGACPSPRTLFS